MSWAGTATLVAAGAIVVGACDSESAGTTDNRQVLSDLATHVIVPSTRDLDTAAAALATATAALRDAPTAPTLKTAQSAWLAAHAQWRRLDALAIGPGAPRTFADNIEFAPVGDLDFAKSGHDAIEPVIAGTAIISTDSVAALATNARGLKAVEYLLFDNVNGDSAVLVSLQDPPGSPVLEQASSPNTGSPALRRRTYAAAAAEAVHRQTTVLAQSWSPDGGNYAATFVTAGAGSKDYPTQKSAIDALVYSAIATAENVVRSMRVAGTDGGAPVSEYEGSPRSNSTAADLASALSGLESAYTGSYAGAVGQGLSDVVKPRSEPIDASVRAKIAAAKAAIAAIPAPIETSLVANPAAVKQAYLGANDLKATLTHMASSVGSSLTFGDRDGD